MEEPHAQVHRHGRDALAAYQSGDLAGGVEAVARMEQASKGVLECLERMAINGDESPDTLCMDH
jgi:methyl-accepting chemotaxis protein